MARKQSREPEEPPGGELRLQAYLARAGVASRRHSEELIAQGRVQVNGATVTAPGTKVRPGRDRVVVDGDTVDLGRPVWIALHKPRGYTTSRHDQYGRQTVYELLPENYRSLFHVGRLDRDSEGLLLLTNDGETANRLLHPSFGTTKEYLADVEGKATAEELRRLVEGVELEDGVARAESVERVRQVDLDLFRIRIVLREGKKREVRRMLEAIGHPVRRLVRQRFGPVELGELPKGKWRVVQSSELARVAATPRPRKETAAKAGATPEAGRRGKAARPATKPAGGPAGRRGAKPGARGRPAREEAESPGRTRSPAPRGKGSGVSRGRGDEPPGAPGRSARPRRPAGEERAGPAKPGARGRPAREETGPRGRGTGSGRGAKAPDAPPRRGEEERRGPPKRAPRQESGGKGKPGGGPRRGRGE